MLDLKKIKTDKVKYLQDTYKTFVYENFNYKLQNNSLVVSFAFKIAPDIEFNPKIEIENVSGEQLDKLDISVLENFIFHVGLVEMISYWKSTCSPNIEVKAGKLNEAQITWWKNLLQNGL